MARAKWLAAVASVATTLMTAGSALALSCLPPSLERSFEQWRDSPDTYYLVSGTLTPAAPLPPVPKFGDLNGGIVDTSNLRGVYRVQGEVIYAQQSIPIDHYIWVRVSCAGPWCGNFPSAGTAGVIALKQLPDQTLELSTGPCPGDVFPQNGGQTKARLQQCLTSGCPPQGPLFQ